MKTVAKTLDTAEVKVFLNHIYEYNKGVRRMILCTLKKEYEQFAINRLESRSISYLRQEAGPRTVNLFFGRPECIDAVRHFASRPLNTLTPEEDFILGALLGYDICQQCKRFCSKRNDLFDGQPEVG